MIENMVELGANDLGTVFKMTAEGTLTTLYSFCSQANCADGEYPEAGLVQANNGNFYGTTMGGGAHNYGTVFTITAEGTLTTLYSFCSKTNCTDGEYPYAGLVQATNGKFYGTTDGGGAHNYGEVFDITAEGTLTTLYSLCSDTNCNDGADPYAGLAQATNGTLYGTTIGGGSDNDGTVFSLPVGLAPFVETLPTSGGVGAEIIILWNDLTSASAVTFNGTAAAFTVISDSEIEATVPVGATTGTVSVAIAGRTFDSNVRFRVTE